MSLAEQFWKWFSAEAAALNLGLVRGDTRAVFDKLDRMLQFHGISYAFDITSDDSGGLLIFSPEGDREVGRRIDQFVGGRVNVGPWRIFSRRQPKDLQDAVAIVRNL